MTAYGPATEDRHPAPPPDIPAWLLYLVVITFWVASVLAAGGLAVTWLDLPHLSWAFLGVMLAGLLFAWLLILGGLSLVYGWNAATRARPGKLGESASASILAGLACFLVWWLTDWIMESLVFGIRFGDWSSLVGVTFMLLIGPATYQWIRECRWARWHAVAEAARAGGETKKAGA